jgi:hypothetical protein
MPHLLPTAVIGQWINDDRTRGFMLQADGDLVAVERERPSDMWSPPTYVGSLQGSIYPLSVLIKGLTA